MQTVDTSPPAVPLGERSQANDSGPVAQCGPVAVYFLQWLRCFIHRLIHRCIRHALE